MTSEGIPPPSYEDVEAIGCKLLSGLPAAEELMEGRRFNPDAPTFTLGRYAIGVPGKDEGPVGLSEIAAGIVRVDRALDPQTHVDGSGLYNARVLPADADTPSVWNNRLRRPLNELRRLGRLAGRDVLLSRRRELGSGSLTFYAMLPDINFVDAPGRESDGEGYGERLTADERIIVAALATRKLIMSRTKPADDPDDDPDPVVYVPRPTSSEGDWRHRAICRDEDPELFHPVGTSGPALMQIAEAKSVCRRCPVVSECLQWALDTGQDTGVWGGLSEDERRALKRHRARRRAHTV